jgi:hypothetical protein
MWSRDMEDLVGKTIKRILVSANDEILAFETDEGVIAYETEGDCCSSTWFESITGVEALMGQTVTSQTTIEMPVPTSREYKGDHYVDELQDYGEKLTTAKGTIDVVYRNSSNGYYGGNIRRLAVAPNLSDFKEITDDWSAA